MKCVTSSFASLFRVLKEPIAITSDTIKKTEVINPQVPKGKAQYSNWANPFMESFRDGIIPARAAKPQVQELKIHHESQKAYPNSPRMA